MMPHQEMSARRRDIGGLKPLSDMMGNGEVALYSAVRQINYIATT